MSFPNRFRLARRHKLAGDPADEIMDAIRLSRDAVRPAAVHGKKRESGDFVVAALGITLGLTCALFPWYIFFNPEKFGVREFVFDGSRGKLDPTAVAYQPQLVGTHFTTGDLPALDLDFIPTATVRPNADDPRSIPVSDQPFPSDLVNFRLVHVANGRAMIEDEDGLWVVQPGSRLPDASKVAAIEQRAGRWVLVTTHDKVVELAN